MANEHNRRMSGSVTGRCRQELEQASTMRILACDKSLGVRRRKGLAVSCAPRTVVVVTGQVPRVQSWTPC
jgi:hypothetical protein